MVCAAIYCRRERTVCCHVEGGKRGECSQIEGERVW